jgi:hypothetical protein
MTVRTTRKTVVFRHPFRLKGVDRALPAGDYAVITDEELIEELSFPVYRRIATMILLPGPSGLEMVTIDATVLQDAMRNDNVMSQVQPGPGAPA